MHASVVEATPILGTHIIICCMHGCMDYYVVRPWILTELKLAETELEAQTHNLTEAQERWECSE